MLDDLEIVCPDWESFQKDFAKKWKPGEHMSLIGPTGTGKSTLMVGILPIRRYVLAVDPKGGDSTLSALKKHGFEESNWPPSKDVKKRIEEGKPARLIIGSNIRTTEDLPKQKEEIQKLLKDVFDQKGWTVYIDELQIAADKRLMGLAAPIERNLIAARDRKVSMVMSFQRPANVPRAASEMSTWMAVFYTRDREVVQRLAEMTGRETAYMRGMIKGLPKYAALVFSRDPREPVIVVKPEKAN